MYKSEYLEYYLHLQTWFTNFKKTLKVFLLVVHNILVRSNESGPFYTTSNVY